jgi:ubiquinone/menaquinone biosynthesis C-methylase UbiE
LDAGCGGGGFLPLIAELVGSKGHISAIDLAPENIERVDALVENSQFPCAVDTRVGNLTSLPYEDNRFDAVWCANTTQYLTNDELSQMLAEFRRVVRPGGLVAVKKRLDG